MSLSAHTLLHITEDCPFYRYSIRHLAVTIHYRCYAHYPQLLRDTKILGRVVLNVKKKNN